MTSKIIHTLSDDEIKLLKHEIEYNKNLWRLHNYPAGARRYTLGESIFIYDVFSHFTPYIDNKYLFPQTVDFLVKKLNSTALMRTYWHKLMPGDYVYTHVDTGTYFDKVDRYQIYFDVPFDCVIVIDEKLWNINENTNLSNKIVYFDKSLFHTYFNLSNSPVIILICDILKTEN